MTHPNPLKRLTDNVQSLPQSKATVISSNVRFFKKDQANAMSEQRQSCKLAINLIVGVVTLYSSVRNSHITEEIKKTITIKQGEVQVPSLQQIDSWWLRRS
ncbi:hypothetical protein WAI453_013184 [Rhynchosporium graminicola]